MQTSLTGALIVVAFIIGIGAGYIVTPEYTNMSQDRQSGMMELGNADRYVDLRYINGMIAHHQSAIYMLEQAQSTSNRAEIKNLAGAVIEADTKGIAELYELKNEWYGDQRKVTKFTQTNIGDSDEKFDLRLLNALLIHHEQAIENAQEIQTKSSRTETLNIANDVITTLSANADQLQAWRKEWYGI